MANRKSTKRALLTSVLSMMICVVMLIGTTFAWFTDSVTSANNRIQAGNLKIDLLMDKEENGTYASIANETGDIFNIADKAQNSNNTLWEPNKTQVVYLAIENKGTLDAKYKVTLDVTNGTTSEKPLTDVLEYAITPNATIDSKVTAWDETAGKTVVEGEQEVAVDVFLEAKTTHYFALSVHMLATAGNEYQKGTVAFDMRVDATQAASESDSFDNTYDQKAVYEEEEQIEKVAWHALDAVHNDTEIDGKGYTYAEDYQEICLAGDADITIKGVTFQNGLTLYTNGDVSGTITLENCVIYLSDGTNTANPSWNMSNADYGLYIGAIDEDVTYVFKNCEFKAYDTHVYTNTDKGYNVYIGGNYSAESITFAGCSFSGSGKHGIGCSYAYGTETNPNTYFNLVVTGCNFIDWNNGNYDGAAIRGNIVADIMSTYNKTITITGNTFGNSNGSAKANVAIDGWTGTWN